MKNILNINHVTSDFKYFLLNRLLFLARDIVFSTVLIMVIVFISYFIRISLL